MALTQHFFCVFKDPNIRLSKPTTPHFLQLQILGGEGVAVLFHTIFHLPSPVPTQNFLHLSCKIVCLQVTQSVSFLTLPTCVPLWAAYLFPKWNLLFWAEHRLWAMQGQKHHLKGEPEIQVLSVQEEGAQVLESSKMLVTMQRSMVPI